MMKSNNRTSRYRPGTSTRRGSLSTFRDQMADYAKGSMLRELRAASRLTREKVAAEIGVTTKSVYAWENDGGIKIENAEKLAELYGVEDPETLITRSTEGGDLLVRIEGLLETAVAKLEAIEVELSDMSDRQAELEAGILLLAGDRADELAAVVPHGSARGPRSRSKRPRKTAPAG